MKFSLFSLILLIIVLLILSVSTAVFISTHSGQATTSGQSTTSDHIKGESSLGCFVFSNVTSKESEGISGMYTVYEVSGKLTNTCMKNFGRVCINATFYDSDNFVVESKNYPFQQLQHGTTVGFFFNSICYRGAGTNKAVRHFFKAYECELGDKNL